ncbi:hypothetical protein DFP73DRAFT_333811 [Morchella snyderi]|nr:hypothetical protein DFP73DRAFT_333811 [Morchella snyderi]
MSSSGRPLFRPSPPPLRPLSPVWASPSPSTQPSPQAQPPVQPRPQPQIQQPQVQPQVPPQPQSSPRVQPPVQPRPQPQIQQPQVQSQAPPQPQSNPQVQPPVQPRPQPQIQQPQVQSQVSPQPQPQVQLETQLQTSPKLLPQPPLQTQPDVQPAPPPQPDPPALGLITTKEMIFHISHYEGNDQTFTLHGRDFLSPEGFNWNMFLGVLTKMMSFKEVTEVLVVNLHHLVEDGLSLDQGIPFYRKVNDVLIVKADPLGRPPTELWERIKSERKRLRERFME